MNFSPGKIVCFLYLGSVLFGQIQFDCRLSLYRNKRACMFIEQTTTAEKKRIFWKLRGTLHKKSTKSTFEFNLIALQIDVYIPRDIYSLFFSFTFLYMGIY